MDQNKGLVRITLAIVMLTSFISPFMGNAINLAIPAIGVEFNGNQFWLNWIVSSYLLSSAAFLLPFGRMADLVGRKKVFLLGMILFAVTTLACALATSLPALVWFRVLQGIASAMVFGTAMAILTSVVSPQARGKAMGLSAAATYTGLSSGPVLGGLICSIFNWRGIFYFNFVLSLIAIGLTVGKLRGEWFGSRSEKFDTWGSIYYVAGLTLLLYGLANLTTAFTYALSFLAGVIFLIMFVRYEMRVAYPLLPVNTFLRNRVFAFSNLAALINYSATFALVFVISLYLQTVRGFDTTTSGLILLSQPIIMAVLSPVAGSLSDRIEPRLLASLGMGLTVLGLFFFIFLSKTTSVGFIVLALAFIGLGFALFSSPNTNAVMSAVDRTSYGVASSTLGTMRLLGQSFSMTIISLITSFLIGDLTLTSPRYVLQFMISLRLSFIVFTILCAVGVFASLARGGSHSKA